MLICGGDADEGADDEATETSCEVWTGAGWAGLGACLGVKRVQHSAWVDPATSATLLLGGYYGPRSGEAVTRGGEVEQAALALEHDAK